MIPCECPLGDGAHLVGCPHHGIPSGAGFDASWIESAEFVVRLLLHVFLGGKLRVWHITRGRLESAVLFELLQGEGARS